jgi:hypothetical protein
MWMALIALTVALAAVGCSGTTHGVRENQMRVELDAFSGRPNPSWYLTEAQARELLLRLQNLPRDGGAPRQGLGYRGLIVTGNSKDLGGFDCIVLSDGVVLGERGTRAHHFRDEGRAFERWLFGTGEDHLDPHLYTTIAREFGP